jgi:hypothetical protein
VRNTVPLQLRGILETITYASQAVPELIARYFGFLPDANFCFCSSIQASISMRNGGIGALVADLFQPLNISPDLCYLSR